MSSEVSTTRENEVAEDTDAAPPAKVAPVRRSNPFGAARPREQVIAEREGKNEAQLLKELAIKEWIPSTMLSEEQLEEKKELETEIGMTKSEIEKADDASSKQKLGDELKQKEQKLLELLDSFEKLAVEKAQAGTAKRPSERRREAEERGVSTGVPQGSGGYGGRGGGQGYSGTTSEGYGSFGRRDRSVGGERPSSYGDAWSGRKSSGGGGACYNCGEVGHFSRECPTANSSSGYSGGGYGSRAPRACYSCGQEGHIARDCPAGVGGGNDFGGSQSYGSSRSNYGSSYGN